MKVHLRDLEIRDFETFKYYANDKDVNEFHPFVLYNAAKEIGFENFLNRPNEKSYAICLRDNGELIGDIGARYKADSTDIGLTIFRKELWGQGLGYDAIAQLLDVLSKDGVKIVTLTVNKENTRALGLYRKIGFKVYGEKDNKHLMNLVLR